MLRITLPLEYATSYHHFCCVSCYICYFNQGTVSNLLKDKNLKAHRVTFVLLALFSCSRRQFEQCYCTATKFSCPFKKHIFNLIIKKY